MWGLHVEGDVEPDHPGVPLGKSGVTVRRWPPRYLTPSVRLYLALWWQQQKGRALRPDPVTVWPARLVNVLSAIDSWPPLWSRQHERIG